MGMLGNPNPGLMEFAARAHTPAFTTLLQDSSKRARDGGEEASVSSGSLKNRPADFTALQDAIMGVQGGLGVRLMQAEYCTVHGGLKTLSEQLMALEGMVLDRIDALDIGAIRLEASLDSSRSIEVKTWMAQTQGMGGGKEGRRIRVEMEALRGWCNFFEGAFAQMTNFVINLKNQLDWGGGELRS